MKQTITLSIDAHTYRLYSAIVKLHGDTPSQALLAHINSMVDRYQSTHKGKLIPLERSVKVRQLDIEDCIGEKDIGRGGEPNYTVIP